MKVLVIGSGAREHALGWKISRSPQVSQVFFSPGNAGTATIGTNLEASEEELIEFCRDEGVNLTVVGPEAPLASGVVNRFRAAGLCIFGPTAEAAKLESSKAFAKKVMLEAGVPTAQSREFSEVESAVDYIEGHSKRVVIKADGLAAGKGVIVSESKQEAIAAARDMLCDSRFGDAGARIVVEDFLEGEEASAIAIVSGDSIVPFVFSQDYKRVFDGQKGPNTGGMGAISPTPVIDQDRMPEVVETVFRPVVSRLSELGIEFQGFLYAGLMINQAGAINVLEFNCRLGDPETQVLLMRTETDLVPLFEAGAKGTLSELPLQISDQSFVCLVASSKGYPGKVDDSKVIEVDSGKLNGAEVFFAGVKQEGDQLISSGGRILSVVASGDDISAAREKAYQSMKAVNFEGMHFRTDIGA